MSEKPTKYGNVKTVIDGITFDSKKEATFYGNLKIMKRSGIIKDFELQPKFPYVESYCTNDKGTLGGAILNKYKKYIADFKVIFSDGSIEIWDVKGFRTTIYKQKKKIVEKLYGIKIIEK